MVLWILAALIAYFIKGLCGFANTLVFTSILSFGASNANISPIDLLVNYPSNLVMIYKNRRALNWKIYAPLAALVLAGSIPGAFLLKSVNAGAIKLLFGAVVVLLGVEMLLRQFSKRKLRSSKAALAIVGIVAGALCGLFGVGALLAAYVRRVTDDQSAFKANINAVFFVDNTVRAILYSALGLITLETLRSAAILLPFSLIGLSLGIWTSSKFNERISKIVISALLILSGISLILAQL